MDRDEATVKMRRTPAALLVTAVGAAAALVLLYVAAVRTAAGQLVDTRLMLVVADTLHHAEWTRAALALISPATLLLGTTAVVGVALALRGGAVALAAGATVVGTVAAAQVLKLVLIRPDWLDAAGNSLPSGHVAAAAGLGAALVVALPRALKVSAALLALAAVAVTGVATMALTWHRPSDVVASALVAVCVASVASAAVATRPRHSPLSRTAGRAT